MNFNRPASIQIGQEVYIARFSTWDTTHNLAKVVKVTPSGLVDVVLEADTTRAVRRFGANDVEFGTANKRWMSCSRLEWNVAGVKESQARRQLTRDVERAVQLAAVPLTSFRDTHGLQAAREAVAAARKMLDDVDAMLK